MASRPISQQGMEGSNTPLTAGMNRSFQDKRYYISSIQNHMMALTDEINRLKKQVAESKFEATNYEACKKQAEEYTKQLSKQEETLMIYNTAIETVMVKGNKNDIDVETENIRRSKMEKIHQLESMYSEKLQLEEKLAKTERDLESEKQLFNKKISEMPEDMQENYYSLKQENDKLKHEEKLLLENTKQLKTSIDNFEQHIFRNEKKHVMYNLSTKLNDIQRRYYKLEEENKVKRSPSQEREYLLEQVKQDRVDIEVLKVQCDEQRKELEKQKGRLSELEDELSEKNSVRLNKYRELLRRQETMTTFLQAFSKMYNDEFSKSKEFANTIVNSLEYISRNIVDNNLTKEVEKNPDYIFQSGVSKEDIEKEYKKYKMQYNMLTSIYERHTKEMDELKVQNQKAEEDLSTYQDIELAKQNSKQQQIDLEMKVATLGSTLKSTVLAVAEAEKRKKEIETQLESNEDFRNVVNLENKLQKLIEENKKIESIIDNNPGLRNFQKFKTKSMEEIKLIFQDLKTKYEGKK